MPSSSHTGQHVRRKLQGVTGNLTTVGHTHGCLQFTCLPLLLLSTNDHVITYQLCVFVYRIDFHHGWPLDQFYLCFLEPLRIIFPEILDDVLGFQCELFSRNFCLLVIQFICAFSVLILLVRHLEEHPTCKIE